ncbi:hypothetical protein A2U01_0092844, partial [Trifolium medium]|nr:hypothetical protein [Trifolium medium]
SRVSSFAVGASIAGPRRGGG